MKKLTIIAVLLISGACYSQTYKYYFFNIAPNGGKGIQVTTEKDVAYAGIDTFIVSSRDGKKVVYKYFPTNSEAYTALSKAGLEFVSFVGESSILGSVTLWRKP